jgi:hypothetical protein
MLSTGYFIEDLNLPKGEDSQIFCHFFNDLVHSSDRIFSKHLFKLITPDSDIVLTRLEWPVDSRYKVNLRGKDSYRNYSFYHDAYLEFKTKQEAHSFAEQLQAEILKG